MGARERQGPQRLSRSVGLDAGAPAREQSIPDGSGWPLTRSGRVDLRASLSSEGEPPVGRYALSLEANRGRDQRSTSSVDRRDRVDHRGVVRRAAVWTTRRGCTVGSDGGAARPG
jgi:hypothetical protein